MADHTLVDLSINYEMSDDLMILLTIENVFDDNYEEVFGYKTLGLGGSVGFRYQM
jgi:vitamin B12 transporter